MNKEINLKAVSFKAVSLKVVLLSIPLTFLTIGAVAIIVSAMNIKYTTSQTYIIIFLLSITIIIIHKLLLRYEKAVTCKFENDRIHITEKKTFKSSHSEQTMSTIFYNDIKSYNAYSILFLFKKIGYVLRIRSTPGYEYYLNWVSADKDKDRFNKNDFEDLKNRFNNSLGIAKKIDFTDILILLMVSILPQIILIVSLSVALILIWVHLF